MLNKPYFKKILKGFVIVFILSSLISLAQVFIPFGVWGGAQLFTLKNSTLTISSASLWVGDVVTLTVSARGRTNMLYRKPGRVVTISAIGSGTSVGTISAVTDVGDGTYTATLTGVTMGSVKNLTATIDGVTLTSTFPTFIVTGRSCAAMLAAGYTSSGVYTIDVDGGAGATTSFSVYCDQVTDGGGWMLAAIPRRTSDTFAEPSGLLSPSVAGPQRNADIWSANNFTVLFTKLRLTNKVPGTASISTNIATFATSQTIGGLMAAYPTYSQTNVILSGASISSTIGSTCFIIRGKSGNFVPYDDSSDWMFMGFHSSCTTPFNLGDFWDNCGTACYKTEWLIGARDDGDGATANHAVGIPTSNVDWEFSVGGTIIDNPTIVWLK